MDSAPLLQALRAGLSGDRTRKVLRFLLNIAASTPYVGGIFGAIAAAWGDSDQARINSLVASLQGLFDDELRETQSALVLARSPNRFVAGKVTLDTYTGRILDAFGAAAVVDLGRFDFGINFSRPLNNYVFVCYGDAPVVLSRADQTPTGLRLSFQEPVPHTVTIAILEARVGGA
jgi:hypothetical protein